MLRTIIIGTDSDLAQKLESLFTDTGRFGLLRSIDRYPEGAELERTLRAHAPHVVFLCVEALSDALVVRSGIERTVPGVPIVAFGRSASQHVLMELMKIGVREFLALPFSSETLLELADRIEEQLAKNPLSFDTTDLMLSFLPAKPGVGASTLALNLSIALSRCRDTKVLLADFDLNSGLIAFMLKISGPYSLVDAADKSAELDENLWPQLVTKVGDLDVLPSGRSEPGARIQPAQIQTLLTFARRHYGAICVDLSGNMEKYSVELMQESKQIFLVTTPEIPPLHLARERYIFLRQLDLGDRVSVLLNRWQKRNAMSVSQIEDLLEVPVYETFPNSYNQVHQALVSGSPIDAGSELGKRIAALANRILNPDSAQGSRPKKRFLQHFSVLPAKYSVKT